MNDGQPRCQHGVVGRVVPYPDYGEGWVQIWAKGCLLCDGKPAGIPYKEPQKKD